MGERIKIPKNWQWTQLGQLCELVNGDRGKNYPSKDKLSSEGTPFVNAGHLKDNQISTEGMNYINGERFELLRSGKFGIGDILFCIRGSLGKVALNTTIKKGAIASSLIIVRPHQEVYPQYTLYYLASPLATNMIEKFDNGTAQPNLSGADLARFEFPLPPHREQLRIVTELEKLFSELDKGIESLKTAREQLKVYRQAVLKHAFEGKLTAKWREDNKDKLETADQLLARIKKEHESRYQQQLEEWKDAVKAWEKEGKKGKKPSKPKSFKPLEQLDRDALLGLPSLPCGWKWVPLSWLLTLTKKPMTTGPFGTMLKKHEHQARGVPVLGIENIGQGKFVKGNKIFVSDNKAQELQSFEVESGEIIISRSGTVGEICEVPDGLGRTLISTNLLRVSFNQNAILSPFFVFMFQGGGSVKSQVKELCKGSSRDFLNQSILQSIVFPLCGLEEQIQVIEEVESKLSRVEKMSEEIEENLDRLAALRQSILKRVFSGKLVEQNPNDEPASVLLERIRAEKAKQVKPTKRKKRKTAA